jgi:putative transposase
MSQKKIHPVQNLKEFGLITSMCVGDVYQNVPAESLNKTIKSGEINSNEYNSLEDTAESIFQYIERYNPIRPHSALNGLSPIEFQNLIERDFIDKKNFECQ